MSHQPHDLTPLPDLLHGAALAGPLRTRKPIYADLLPPCNAGCPAGENIQAWLASTRAGEHERAGRFDERFIELARSIYHENDHRAVVKRQINELTGSQIVEEKSYV